MKILAITAGSNKYSTKKNSNLNNKPQSFGMQVQGERGLRLLLALKKFSAKLRGKLGINTAQNSSNQVLEKLVDEQIPRLKAHKDNFLIRLFGYNEGKINFILVPKANPKKSYGYYGLDLSTSGSLTPDGIIRDHWTLFSVEPRIGL